MASVALAHVARAQSLAGIARDSISRLPIAGAVVTTLDSAGGTLARGLSNERGEYRVAMREGARTARIVRIGFVPVEVPLPPATGGTIRLDVTMYSLPSMLQAQRVLANSNCSTRRDRAEALGLWEQARAGLLATIVAREENPAKVVRLGFYRVMDGNSDRIERMRVERDSAEVTAKTYVAALAAADFVRFGFSTDSLASATFFGPDADVLLNDAFAGAYCFQLADRQRSRPTQVGLRFLPADHRKGRVDIDGTLWIDTLARALVGVEYRYLNVEAGAVRFRPGGYVSFRSMKNGVVMIDRWWIRVVNASPDTVVAALGGLQPRDWLYAEEDGGELERAAWPDGLEWKAQLGALRVRAVKKDGKPAVGTILSLVATHYYGTADERGIVEIKDLIPGPYQVRVIDPRIAELGIGLPTKLRFTAARDTTSLATLTVPTAESMIADRCVANHVWTVGDSLFTMGRVVTPDGKPVQHMRVNYSVQANIAGDLWVPNPVYFDTGTDGMFEFCHRFTPHTRVRYTVSRNGAVLGGLEGEFTSNLLVPRIVIEGLP
jgi:hypothetical protein